MTPNGVAVHKKFPAKCWTASHTDR